MCSHFLVPPQALFFLPTCLFLPTFPKSLFHFVPSGKKERKRKKKGHSSFGVLGGSREQRWAKNVVVFPPVSTFWHGPANMKNKGVHFMILFWKFFIIITAKICARGGHTIHSTFHFRSGRGLLTFLHTYTPQYLRLLLPLLSALSPLP